MEMLNMGWSTTVKKGLVKFVARAFVQLCAQYNTEFDWYKNSQVKAPGRSSTRIHGVPECGMHTMSNVLTSLEKLYPGTPGTGYLRLMTRNSSLARDSWRYYPGTAPSPS
eukprot:953790-Rhodomonas_salina.2